MEPEFQFERIYFYNKYSSYAKRCLKYDADPYDGIKTKLILDSSYKIIISALKDKKISKSDIEFFAIDTIKHQANLVVVRKKPDTTISFFKCAACDHYGITAPIHKIANHPPTYKCESCQNTLSNLNKIPKENLTEDIIHRIKLHNIFKIHSSTGKNCPNCKFYIPKSYFINQDNKIIECFNCNWSGDYIQLKNVFAKRHIDTIYHSELQPNVSKEKISEENNLIVREEFNENYAKLSKAMDNVAKKYKNFNLSYKYMFAIQAYQRLLESNPIDTIQYICYEISKDLDYPCSVFQQYVSIVEENMPIYIKNSQKGYVIDSLFNKKLNIYLGTAEFVGTVHGGIIKNETNEYLVGSNNRVYGRMGIGTIKDITDINSNKSYYNNIVCYNCSKINVKNIPDGTMVNVSHNKISAHKDVGAYKVISKMRNIIIAEFKEINNV